MGNRSEIDNRFNRILVQYIYIVVQRVTPMVPTSGPRP
jgi:hypothetical protein